MTVWAELDFERITPENPHVILYRLSGALTGSKQSYDFLETVKRDIKTGFTTVVINLSQVERITSSGIGIVCTCLTSAQSADGRLIIVGVSERNQALMRSVGVWAVVTHFASEDELVLE